MRVTKGLRIAGCALLLAALAWLVMATPGFISHRDSIAPIHPSKEASQ
jgi:hypothetical protein